jgi:hypothetical protein
MNTQLKAAPPFSQLLKTLFIPAIIIACFVTSCAKNTPDRAVEDLPSGTIISSGTFQNNAHPVSGTVKLIQDASGKKSLVFENFRSDNGPDLWVWLSSNTNAANYQEVGLLKAVNGHFSYELSPSVNHTSNNKVLIWCKGFSVLFGHAVLQ